MLIEFRVENHRSLRDEQVLTMEATPRVGAPDDLRPRTVEGHDKPLLPAAVLYGANASGKSNVLSALAFMRESVLHSHKYWDASGGVPRDAFRWGSANQHLSAYIVSVMIKGTRYEYGFSTNDHTIEEEWVYAWPNGRKVDWFVRENQQIVIGNQLKVESKEQNAANDAMKTVTRPNALFLSVAAQHQHPLLSQIYLWFLTSHFVPTPALEKSVHRHDGFNRLLWSKHDFSDDSLAENLRAIFRAADIGIVDVRIEDEVTDRNGNRPRIRFQHQLGDETAWLDLGEESIGTQRLFRLATPIYQTLANGGRLIVDELEASLHPLLGQLIIRIFNNPKTNPRNAQLLFTTHDTNLLGTTLGEPPLRRDQIWFTEKDKEGATKLYPLTDYKPRKEENLERGYLQGRYGAIPFLGDMTWITE